VLGASTGTLDLELPAAPLSVAKARRALCAYAARCGWKDLWPVKLAISEAVGNVVLHAYPDDAEDPRVRIRADYDGSRLLVSVEDDGVGMRPRIDSPGLGLGVSLIENVADRLILRERSEGGLEVQVCFADRAHPAACA
jgi:anti-sigma regulatory factor (Ser/Thr protein kinase)